MYIGSNLLLVVPFVHRMNINQKVTNYWNTFILASIFTITSFKLLTIVDKSRLTVSHTSSVKEFGADLNLVKLVGAARACVFVGGGGGVAVEGTIGEMLDRMKGDE